MNIRVFGHIGLLIVAAAVLMVSGCAKSTHPVVSEEAILDGEQLEQAQRLYAQLQREHSLHRDRKCLELAGTLLDYYPAFDRNDEVLSVAVQSAYRLDDYGQALTLTEEFRTKFPTSPLLD